MKGKGIKRMESKKRYFRYIPSSTSACQRLTNYNVSCHQPWLLPPHIATMGTGELHNLDFALPTCIPAVRMPTKRCVRHFRVARYIESPWASHNEVSKGTRLETGGSCLFGGENRDFRKVKLYPCTSIYLPHNRQRSALNARILGSLGLNLESGKFKENDKERQL